jgi:hypothetical protein
MGLIEGDQLDREVLSGAFSGRIFSVEGQPKSMVRLMGNSARLG